MICFAHQASTKCKTHETARIFHIIIINIFMQQTRLPFDYTTVMYSTEGIEIKLALNCKDF